MKLITLLLLNTTLLGICTPYTGNQDPRLEKIKLPEGFRIEVFADSIENARSMVLGDEGTLFVGSRRAGNIYAITDTDKDNKADKIITIASGLNSPNGVAFKNGSLYVAEISRIIRFDNLESKLANPPKPVVVNDSFPTDEHHGWKYIAFGPDGKLYVPVGAPCNICNRPDDPRFSTIMRMNDDGSGLEIFSHGIRNSVGFAWHPQTKELWFTENGGDRLGDDRPEDELNHAPVKGMHFGFPFCHAGDLPDEDHGKDKKCSDYISPAIKLGPHVAALGMKFYTGKMFPAEYNGQVFIAEHGSWNRSKPIGYRVTMVTIKDGKATAYKPFAEGWLEGSSAWGRPVDVLQMPDGSLLVSDDDADMIYRISYSK